MYCFPDTEKKLKSTISRYRSALKREESAGYISDGSGKRYMLFALYFVQNDLSASEQYVEWYEQHFPDDRCDDVLGAGV